MRFDPNQTGQIPNMQKGAVAPLNREPPQQLHMQFESPTYNVQPNAPTQAFLPDITRGGVVNPAG
jgi:hypothetical protein